MMNLTKTMKQERDIIVHIFFFLLPNFIFISLDLSHALCENDFHLYYICSSGFFPLRLWCALFFSLSCRVAIANSFVHIFFAGVVLALLALLFRWLAHPSAYARSKYK